MGINHRKNGLPDPTLTAAERAQQQPRGTMGATLPSFTVGDVLTHKARPRRASDSGSIARSIAALCDERDFLRREIVNLSREIARLHQKAGR